jgi:hypothetical protein
VVPASYGRANDIATTTTVKNYTQVLGVINQYILPCHIKCQNTHQMAAKDGQQEHAALQSVVSSPTTTAYVTSKKEHRFQEWIRFQMSPAQPVQPVPPPRSPGHMHLRTMIGCPRNPISRWLLPLVGRSIEEGLCWSHRLRRVFLFSFLSRQVLGRKWLVRRYSISRLVFLRSCA